MSRITVVGSGHFVPGVPITNHALARVMNTNHEWIAQRTGVHQRHFAAEGQGATDLAVEAAKRALESAKLTPHDIDYVIFATMTPDYVIPGPGGILAHKLGCRHIPALDIRQQCAAMPYAIQVADGLVQGGAAKTVLLVGAECHAGFMPWKDWDVLYGADREVAKEDYDYATLHRGIAVVFGDGAGALVLRKSDVEGSGYIGSKIVSEGEHADYLMMDAGGFRHRPALSAEMIQQDRHIPVMKGPELFKRAVRELPKMIAELCETHGVAPSDIDCVVAHQANERINDSVRQAMKLTLDNMPSNIARYGNTSAGTIPILLDELIRDGRVKKGDLLCLVALGAGLHMGATLLRL